MQSRRPSGLFKSLVLNQGDLLSSIRELSQHVFSMDARLDAPKTSMSCVTQWEEGDLLSSVSHRKTPGSNTTTTNIILVVIISANESATHGHRGGCGGGVLLGESAKQVIHNGRCLPTPEFRSRGVSRSGNSRFTHRSYRREPEEFSEPGEEGLVGAAVDATSALKHGVGAIGTSGCCSGADVLRVVVAWNIAWLGPPGTTTAIAEGGSSTVGMGAFKSGTGAEAICQKRVPTHREAQVYSCLGNREIATPCFHSSFISLNASVSSFGVMVKRQRIYDSWSVSALNADTEVNWELSNLVEWT